MLDTGCVPVAVRTTAPKSSRSSKIPKEPHHDKRIDRRFDEPEVAVETSCFVVLGVDEQDPYPDRLGHLEDLRAKGFLWEGHSGGGPW